MANLAYPKADRRPDLSAPMALLRRLEWRMRHAVTNVLGGEYRSSFRGRGMEFDQVVKYEYGDDVRDIDWNVTARLGEPYRKKFVEEREVSLLLLFEDTPSLQFGSGERSKRECLLELAALIMLLGAVIRDRVGLVYSNHEGYWFRPPVPGRQAILHNAAGLLSQPAPTLDAPPSADIPWKFLSKAAPAHSIFIWLGDFPSRPEPDGWSVMRRRYEAMGFRVDDPWERDLPPDFEFPAYDPVSGRLVVLNTNSPSQRRAHAEWVRKRQQTFESLFSDPSARLSATVDDSMLDAVIGFFHRRMRSR